MTELSADLLKKMEGVTVALVTPLDAEGRLDVPSLERLLERVVSYGACCVFPLGWCGEQPMLPDEVRVDMLRNTTRVINGRLPVMAGVSEQSLPRVLELAGGARDAGADLILATPPYSYPVSQEFVLEYLADVARLSSMFLVVYQNDDVSVRVEVETIHQLSERPGIIGVKAFMPYEELQAAYHRSDRPGRFAVMSGNEYHYGPALFMGIRHFTMGSPGNLCMKWCVGTYRSAVQGDWDGVRRRHRRLTEFCHALSQVPAPFMAVKKYAMSRLGICSVHVTAPVRMLSAEEQKRVDAAMEQYRELLDPCEA